MKAGEIGFIFPLFLCIVAYTITCENSVEAVSYNANAWKICARVGLEVFCFAAQKGIITSSRHSVVVEKLREKDVCTLTLLVCVFQETIE